MHINLEATEQHAVQAYSDNKIQINSIIFEGSLIVSREEIISDLAIKNIQDIDDNYLNLLINQKPEIIIIGHENTGKFPPMQIISKLSQNRIGLECMSIGAACRTYNVLLSEKRAVIAGFIF
jgi:uncharacterized protein